MPKFEQTQQDNKVNIEKNGGEDENKDMIDDDDLNDEDKEDSDLDYQEDDSDEL